MLIGKLVIPSKSTGAQPEIFKGKGGFAELGHFDKKKRNTRKKDLSG